MFWRRRQKKQREPCCSAVVVAAGSSSLTPVMEEILTFCWAHFAAMGVITNGGVQSQKEKLESLIAEFRLQKVRKNKGNQLSGGERRRTEIARCLAIDPKFIMLDEPFAGVDPIAVEDIQQIVWKLKDKNIGILITDHNVQETLSITDRAYLLFEGKILFQGTPEELAENKIVREKYLSNSFVLRRKDFQLEKD